MYWTTGNGIFLLISSGWGYISPPVSYVIASLVGKTLIDAITRLLMDSVLSGKLKLFYGPFL